MTIRRALHFSEDWTEALAAMELIAEGRGWCNVVPDVYDDVPDLRVNFLGLWSNRGVVMASYITVVERHGERQPSSLGLLHTRGKLGRERIALMLAGAPFPIRLDHSQRGLVLEVPVDTSAKQVLDVMCSMTTALCDYEAKDSWRMDVFTRE